MHCYNRHDEKWDTKLLTLYYLSYLIPPYMGTVLQYHMTGRSELVIYLADTIAIKYYIVILTAIHGHCAAVPQDWQVCPSPVEYVPYPHGVHRSLPLEEV